MGNPPPPPSKDEIDAELSLAIMGYDPKDKYPEWGNDAMREAYRAGWTFRPEKVGCTTTGTKQWTTVDSCDTAC